MVQQEATQSKIEIASKKTFLYGEWLEMHCADISKTTEEFVVSFWF